MDSIENIIEKRKQRWISLYENKEKSGAVILIGRNYGGRPLPYPENKTGRIEYGVNAYKMQMESLEYTDEDMIPFLLPYTGTEVFAAAFGCKVSYPAGDMPFALPLVRNSREVAKLALPDPLNSPPTAEIFEIADKLRESAPNAMMHLPDIQSPLDVAALIWNKEDFFAAMYEDPEAVTELVAMTEKFLCDFLDIWYARYGTEFIAHHPDYYMPYGVTFSEDEVGAISPDMFARFSLGSLNRLADRYGLTGMHCCADSGHQWENFKAIKNLALLNLNLTHTPDRYPEAYKYFEDSCVQMHARISDGQWQNDNKNMRVVIQDWANDNNEAREKSKALREKYSC
ncbi:MAG: hypothetical protein FWG34_04020 [Oscillospiraceae bacterium]|nr:hypothetical protein [Oscillospiraceae bacterium]